MSGGKRLDWRDRIRKGDVLRAKSGALRVVRNVKHWRSRYGTYCVAVNFAIMRCSWTHQCVTCYTRTDLKTMGFRPTGVRVRLTRAIDKLIARAIAALRNDSLRAREIADCCDVQGVQ